MNWLLIVDCYVGDMKSVVFIHETMFLILLYILCLERIIYGLVFNMGLIALGSRCLIYEFVIDCLSVTSYKP